MPLVLRVTRREGARIPARVSGFAYSAPGACANPDSARGSNGPSTRITSAGNLPACDRYYDIIGQCGSRAGRKVKPISSRAARSRGISNLETAVSRYRIIVSAREIENGGETADYDYNSNQPLADRVASASCYARATLVVLTKHPARVRAARSHVYNTPFAFFILSRSLSLSLSFSRETRKSPVGAIFAEACKISGRPCRHA